MNDIKELYYGWMILKNDIMYEWYYDDYNDINELYYEWMTLKNYIIKKW